MNSRLFFWTGINRKPNRWSGKKSRLVVQPSGHNCSALLQDKKSPEYKERKSLKVATRKGMNTIYFFLPLDEITGSIRLDPGDLNGVYRISSIEIRGL